jgi:hypothetical protein
MEENLYTPPKAAVTGPIFLGLVVLGLTQRPPR